MKDIESQSMQNTMSLRKRKNLQSMSGPSNLTSSEKELLRKHSTLMKQINSAKDDDDLNEDERQLMELIKKRQIEGSNAMLNGLLRFLLCILVVLILIYAMVRSYQPTDEPSVINSLVKVLKILFGLKTNSKYLSSSKFISPISVSKDTIDNFLVPAWPWQRGSSSAAKRYLVPGSASRSVKRILHESLRLKHERGLNIDLYDNTMMRQFLLAHGTQCEDNKDHSIMQKFDELRQYNAEGHKYLWMWCMIYAGNVSGYIDIENHDISITHNLLRKLSLGNKPYGIENAIIVPNTESSIQSNESILPLCMSMLFSSIQKSSLVREMLQYMLQNPFDELEMIGELNKLVDKARLEGENWTLLKAHCTNVSIDEFKGESLAKVCRVNESGENEINQHCCYLVL